MGERKCLASCRLPFSPIASWCSIMGEPDAQTWIGERDSCSHQSKTGSEAVSTGQGCSILYRPGELCHLDRAHDWKIESGSAENSNVDFRALGGDTTRAARHAGIQS